jgi:CheY-like chemotaxis protein
MPPDRDSVAGKAAKRQAPDDVWPDSVPAEDCPRLDGLRVLVVEDEYLVALLLEEDLRSSGCTIIGPHTTLDAATAAGLSEPVDLAILDVNLNGEMVYPLAGRLADRGVPVVFLSGYGVGHFPERFRNTPRVPKPHDRATLIREIERALATRSSPG